MSIKRKILRILVKTFKVTAIIFLLQVLALLVSLYLVFKSSYVQTYLARKAADYISEKIQFPVTVESVDINWIDEVEIQGLRIKDLQGKEFIYLGELKANYYLKSLFLTSPELEKIVIANLDFRVRFYKEAHQINVDEFVRKLRRAFSKKSKTSSGRALFDVKHVELVNTTFSYYDERFEHITDAFDYYHFTFDSINAVVNNFEVLGDTLSFPIKSISAIDRDTKLRVKHINTNMLITEFSMEFNQLYALIGESVVKDKLKFGFKDIEQMSYIKDSVIISANLDSTVLRTEDLSKIFPELHPYHDTYLVYGDIKGIFKKLNFKNCHVGFGERSHLSGSGNIDGLPDFWNSFSELDLKHSKVYSTDFEQYLDKRATDVMRNFGQIDFDGQFIGFPLDFVANGKFDTDLGRFVSDVNLKIKDNEKDSYYKGHIETFGFDFGRLTKMTDIFQRIDMSGEIEGTGFSLNDAKLTLKSEISRFGIYGYDYKKISTNATLSKQYFKGYLSVKDTNLRLTANGAVDLQKNNETIDLVVKLDKANLQPIKLLNDYGYLKTDANIQLKGFDIDELVGNMEFRNSEFEYQDRQLAIDYMNLNAEKQGDIRTLNFKSNLFDLMAKGNFKISKTQEDLNRLWDEYMMYVRNNTEETETYYSQRKDIIPNDYKINLDLKLNNFGPILNLINGNLYLSQKTHFTGELNMGKTQQLTLFGDFDTLHYDNYHFYNNKLDYNSSKIFEKPEILSYLYVNSEEQKLKNVDFEKLNFEGIWSENKINFTGKIKQKENSNSAKIAGDLWFLPNTIQLILQPSEFNVLDQKWTIFKDNKITLTGKEFMFKDVIIENNEKMISLNGYVSDTATKYLDIEVKNFDLNLLTPLARIKLGGIINSTSKINDFYNKPYFDNSLHVNQFMIDSFLVGDIIGKANWVTDKKMLYNELKIYRNNFNVIDLEGFYDPNSAQEELKMNAYLYNTSISIFEPFMAGEITNMEGKANGKLAVGGMLASPALKGKVKVVEGKFRVDYLNTHYTFNDDIHFSENEIYVKSLTLYDENGEKAILEGGVYHDGFSNFGINMSGKFNKALLLDIPKKDADYYYGTAIGTGDFKLAGPFDNMEITANAVSEKGTKIYIPLEGTATVEKLDYITFVNRKVVKKDKSHKAVDVTGIKMLFNFEITTDAYGEIIFDQKAGDIIRGNGNGRISMEIDTRGDFNMYGTYQIEKGAYNFTLLNVINKEFKIEKGGTISFNGDPYQGQLNMNAVYTQMASFYPLVQDTTLFPTLTNSPEAKRRYPVQVNLGLYGNLFTPEIKLGLHFNDYPVLFNDVIASFKQQLNTNEQELNRQVFSLLVLKKLSPPNSFNVSNQAVGGSLSELLTNQLSNWMSQVDDNLDVSLNLNGLTPDAINTIQLRLSYSLLDGRLRITRDGGFTNVQNNVSAATAIGDWTLEYMLSKDGKYRLKIFNKVNQNAYVTGLNNTTTTSAGASIMHTASYDKISDIFRRRKKTKAKTQEEINLSDEEEPEMIYPEE